MAITFNPQATRTVIEQDGVAVAYINYNGSLELVNPPVSPTGNMVTSFNQFGGSLSANGWQKLPSGLIIQWGTYAAGVTSVTFPIAFLNACRSVVISNNFNGASNTPGTYAYTATGFTSNSSSGATAYMAIGY